MKSFIFYFFNNWRLLLNLWVIFIASFLVTMLLKPKININFKKSVTVSIICVIYALLSIFAYYVIGNVGLKILSNVFISTIFFGIGIILYIKSEKLNKITKYAAIVLLLLSIMDLMKLFIKILIKLIL
ncbi:hypothetical protein [Methanocaldococcus infernus]|nr:hypothetical protein [Methanocaldococcus infernus]